jgi:hypothetical protein
VRSGTFVVLLEIVVREVAPRSQRSSSDIARAPVLYRPISPDLSRLDYQDYLQRCYTPLHPTIVDTRAHSRFLDKHHPALKASPGSEGDTTTVTRLQKAALPLVIAALQYRYTDVQMLYALGKERPPKTLYNGQLC